ncbi:MAG: hypothetical protein J6Y20_03695 [Lachnospiraceae bacterium]|nr:hypothetical protein [Lachnospiraceae bacterium]
MSVLIKNVEMPTDHPMWIVAHSDGTVEANEVSASRPVGWQTLRNAAVPVPPHGRLIDADALIKELTLDDEDGKTGATLLMAVFLEVLKAAPTIIPAEEGE